MFVLLGMFGIRKDIIKGNLDLLVGEYLNHRILRNFIFVIQIVIGICQALS